MMIIMARCESGQFEQEPVLLAFYGATTLQPRLSFRWGERMTTEKIANEKRQGP
jgi:hypothetical protein